MKEELKDIFIYKGGTDLPENAYRLSGSTFAKWVSTPWDWYREQVLGLDVFESTTSTILGTCVHLAAECYEKRISNIKEEVEKQLEEFVYDNPNLEIDTYEVKRQFPLMVKALVDGYLVSAPKAIAVEEELTVKLSDNLYAQGAVDRREKGMVVDYKTFNSTTDPKTMPSYYKYQLLYYAWLYSKLDIYIDRIRLVYVSREIDTRRVSEKTGKPIGKLTPARTVVLTEEVSEEDIKWVESMVDLWVDTMNLSIEHPEYNHIIFHDPRLKQDKEK